MVLSMEDIARTKIFPAGGKARVNGRLSGGGGDRNRTDASRFCRPLPYRLATPPARKACMVRGAKILPGGQGTVNRELNGAGNGSRTRDFNLGKVALYH